MRRTIIKAVAYQDPSALLFHTMKKPKNEGNCMQKGILQRLVGFLQRGSRKVLSAS